MTESTAVGDAAIEFDCPRCGRASREAFYGPCAACRDQLRANLAREARYVDVDVYEPKTNVTPNAVALKEDD
jgi:hypothetical protein